MNPRPDHEAVKTLAIAVGVREAARQMGLSQERVMKWSQREQWFKQPRPVPLPPTMLTAEVRSVRKASDVMADLLAEDSKETKISLSKGIRRAACMISQMPEQMLFNGADRVKHIVSSAAQVHGWDEAKSNNSFTLQVLSIGGTTGIKIEQG